MTVIYGLPNCIKCNAAKEKFGIFNIDHEERSYEQYVTYHEGWKNDGSLDVLTAKCFYGDTAVPIIEHDGKMYDYPGFMRKIKEMKKAG